MDSSNFSVEFCEGNTQLFQSCTRTISKLTILLEELVYKNKSKIKFKIKYDWQGYYYRWFLIYEDKGGSAHAVNIDYFPVAQKAFEADAELYRSVSDERKKNLRDFFRVEGEYPRANNFEYFVLYTVGYTGVMKEIFSIRDQISKNLK